MIGRPNVARHSPGVCLRRPHRFARLQADSPARKRIGQAQNLARGSDGLREGWFRTALRFRTKPGGAARGHARDRSSNGRRQLCRLHPRGTICQKSGPLLRRSLATHRHDPALAVARCGPNPESGRYRGYSGAQIDLRRALDSKGFGFFHGGVCRCAHRPEAHLVSILRPNIRRATAHRRRAP